LYVFPVDTSLFGVVAAIGWFWGAGRSIAWGERFRV